MTKPASSSSDRIPQGTLDSAKLPPCQNIVSQAKSLIDAKRYDEARLLLEKVQLDDPDLKTASNLMIRLLSETGRFVAARSAFDFASEKELLASEGCAILIRAFPDMDSEAVLGIFSIAENLGIADTQVYNAVISALLKNGDSNKVNSLYQDAIREQLVDRETFQMMISFRLEVDDLASARKFLKRALESGRADERMCLEIVDYCKKHDLPSKASEILRMGEMGGVWSERMSKERVGLESSEQGTKTRPVVRVENRETRPLDIVERVIGSKSEEAFNCNRQIYHYISIGEADRARKIFDRALEQNLIDTPIYLLILNEYKRIGDVGNARQIFDAAVRNGREDEGLYGIMASVFLDNNNIVQAKELLSQAQERWGYPTHVYDRLFNGYYVNDRYDDIISTISGFPPEVQRYPSVAIWKMNAYRKKKLYALVIIQANTLIARNGIDSDYLIHAKILKAYALIHNWKPVEAFEILDPMSKELSSDNKHYCMAICGLVFAYKESDGKIRLEPSRIEELLRNLEPHRGNRNTNMNADIENARNILNLALRYQHP